MATASVPVTRWWLRPAFQWLRVICLFVAIVVTHRRPDLAICALLLAILCQLMAMDSP